MEIVMLVKAVYRININSNVIFLYKLDKIIQNSHGNTGDHREQKKFIAKRTLSFWLTEMMTVTVKKKSTDSVH